jgi:CheY-like chemotaxis protein
MPSGGGVRSALTDDRSVNSDRARALRVLVVEDHDDSRELLVELFSGIGFVVRGASTAENGLALLREHAHDAIITDFNLGDGVSGGELLERANAEGLLDHAVAVFLYSAHPSVKLPASVPRARMLKKPLDVDALRAEIEQLVRDAEPPSSARAV